MNQLLPAVSVIIPMYNAEKFIAECLGSLLGQSLENFEVVVVDDCSTDSSCAIVENFIPQFAGRLKLARMEKNSGCAPAPRNKGFIISRGEYIFFMDADDVLTETALAEMYTLAKDFDADVVYCEKYFMSTGTGQEFLNNIQLADSRIQIGEFVDKPTFITNDLGERIQELLAVRFWMTPWLRLVSRELLAENEITFPEIIGSDDFVWTFEVLCAAKKFLRVPNICYVRRMYDDSFTANKKSPNKHIHQWMDRTIRGLKFTDNFMNRFEFFRENSAVRYAVLEYFLHLDFSAILGVCADLESAEIYDIFRNEFKKDLGEHDVLVAALCTVLNNQQTTSLINQQNFEQLSARTQQQSEKFKQMLTRAKDRINELEQICREKDEYISELEKNLAR